MEKSIYFKEKITILDKVFFKILASETDLDFEENLAIFLPKLILKLATNEEIIRKKVTFKIFYSYTVNLHLIAHRP